MPITPFHLGPAILFGLLFFRFINLPAFLAGSVVVDIEPFFVLVLGLDYPLHGFFHSFLGGSVAALLVFFVMLRLDGDIRKFMKYFKLEQDVSTKKVLFASFLGVYFHISLDAFLYSDMRPFYPIDVNPLYGMVASFSVYLFCVVSFVLGFLVYGFCMVRKR